MSMQGTEIQTEKKVTCKSGHRRDYRVQFINYKNHNSFQTFYFKVVLEFYFLGVFVVLLGLDCIQGLWTNGENLLRDGLYIAFVHVSIFILIQRFLKSLSERLWISVVIVIFLMMEENMFFYALSPGSLCLISL